MYICKFLFKMKIPRSGDYICKIVYNPSDQRYAEPLDNLLHDQPFTICKIHTRTKSRIWFHEVKKCDSSILKKYDLVFQNEENEPDEYYDPFCGFIYLYDSTTDMYACQNQILKNTGGMVWNLYIKIYKKLE